jgi:signal transduction histidine kinase
MGSWKNDLHPLLVEISHQVNSPLAAIRNAIYLASERTSDPEIIQYLAIADEEISAIVNRIKSLHAEAEASFPSDAPCAVTDTATLSSPDLDAA